MKRIPILLILPILMLSLIPLRVTAQIFPADVKDKAVNDNLYYLHQQILRVASGGLSGTYIPTGAEFGGDVSGIYNNLQVGDNSHNHSDSTLTGLTSSKLIGTLPAGLVDLSTVTTRFITLETSTGVINARVDSVILSTGTLVKKSGDTMTGALNMDGNFIAGVSTITMLGGSIAIVPPGTGGSNDSYGISIGSNAYNNYTGGVGVGRDAYNNHTGGVGVGAYAYNNNTYGVGVGYGAIYNYSYGVGVGYGANYNFSYGVGVGLNAIYNYNHGVGIGANSQFNKNYGTGVGAYTTASSSSVALGSHAKAPAKESLALGAGTVNHSTGTASFGVYAITTSSDVTASAFYGDGAALTGVITSTAAIVLSTGVINAAKVNRAGDTMTGDLILSGEDERVLRITTPGNVVRAVLRGSAAHGGRLFLYNSAGSPSVVLNSGYLNKDYIDTGYNFVIGDADATHKLRVVGGGAFSSSVTAVDFYGSGANLTGVITSTATGNYLLRVATATYLATEPGACTAGQYISGLLADGTKTCGTPSGAGDVVLAATQTFTGANTFTVIGTGVTSISSATLANVRMPTRDKIIFGNELANSSSTLNMMGIGNYAGTIFSQCLVGSTVTITTNGNTRVMVGFQGFFQAPGNAGMPMVVSFRINGVDFINNTQGVAGTTLANIANHYGVSYTILTGILPAGSHSFCATYHPVGALNVSFTLDANRGNQFWVQELR